MTAKLQDIFELRKCFSEILRFLDMIRINLLFFVSKSLRKLKIENFKFPCVSSCVKIFHNLYTIIKKITTKMYEMKYSCTQILQKKRPQQCNRFLFFPFPGCHPVSMFITSGYYPDTAFPPLRPLSRHPMPASFFHSWPIRLPASLPASSIYAG